MKVTKKLRRGINMILSIINNQNDFQNSFNSVVVVV